MKKHLFSLIFVLAAAAGFSQAFKLTDSKGAAYPAGQEFNYVSYADSTLEFEMYIRNISTGSINVQIDRYDDKLNKVGADDSAHAYFCTGLVCLTPFETTNSITLDKDSSISFKHYFKEASVKGESKVRYRFKVNSEEKFYTFNYNKTVGLREESRSLSSALLFPNPASSGAVLCVNSQRKTTGEIRITDVRGTLIYREVCEIEAGTNNIVLPAHELPAGLYFVRLAAGGEVANKTLQIAR